MAKTDADIVHADRGSVYGALNGERKYQDDQKGNARPHPGSQHEAAGKMSQGECLLCMEQLSLKAREAWYRPDGLADFLDHVRKLTAVGVQCMENHGIVVRDGYGFRMMDGTEVA